MSLEKDHKNTTNLQFINPTKLYDPTPNAYSHISIVENFNRVIHIAGQGGENIDGVLSLDFEQQVIQTLENIKNALTAADVNISNIAVLRVLIVDHDDQKHKILIKQIEKMWNNTPFPACTLIPVPRLALPNMLIEIEVTAYC
ncbi:YjgF family translation initiation inhibitor [Acinetobacter sp. ANC 4558]|uniref:RidA family protein n=1 Tax=Acinetobacter sp. ANC 4558 TaxID=1977876 RepID=UPI000A33C7A9|nr:RidA family protein [Acinetobacter sp. ANC 4558]OTG83181.1 YjgF family translation initiation inhibitor [Acinetobacter sp. ANC 4558]